jgi:DnaK suppressor protein
MVSQKTLKTCKMKLLALKAELLNRYHNHFSDLRERETGGDEADQSVAVLQENTLFVVQQRLRSQLSEIESALARIERGTFGICEETDEPIEPERLLAIPWTRLSIEGAEIRESANSKRA